MICSACQGEFDLESEGGIAGDFGILPMAFCPTCFASTVDMVHQLYPCRHCEKFYDEEENKTDWVYSYHITTARVVDGDTVDVVVDYGFQLKQIQRIRLLDVNTPERGKPDWQKATDTTTQLLNEAAALDQRGRMKLTSFKTGKYGRWLGIIESLDGSININSTLEELWPNS